MRRIALLLFMLGTSALVGPGAATGQVPPPRDLAAARGPWDELGSTAARRTPSGGPLALLPSLWPSEPVTEPQPQPQPEPLVMFQARVRNRRGVPFMIAGGILFVAGAVAGDDPGTILMLGGAGIGAYGAFVYFGG